MQTATAGTSESNDIVITVSPCPPGTGINVDLESSVVAQYGNSIRDVITVTLKSRGIMDLHVKAVDRGALDYTIKARVLAALERAVFNPKQESA